MKSCWGHRKLLAMYACLAGNSKLWLSGMLAGPEQRVGAWLSSAVGNLRVSSCAIALEAITHFFVAYFIGVTGFFRSICVLNYKCSEITVIVLFLKYAVV